MKGHGRLLEPEEADRLEGQGYGSKSAATKDAQESADMAQGEVEVEDQIMAIEAKGLDDDLDEEQRRFEQDIQGIDLDEAVQSPGQALPPDDSGRTTRGNGPPETGGVRFNVELEEVEDEEA